MTERSPVDTGGSREKSDGLFENRATAGVAGVGLLLVAGYVGLNNFLLFHFFAEGFTIVVSFIIAVIVFSTYKNIPGTFIPILGIAYFCAGFFDVIHTLSYEGNNIIPGAGPGLAPQMWIIARYLDSSGMLLAGIAAGRTFRLPRVLAAYLLISAAAFLAVFQWNVFPQAFIAGQGLTLFKVYSEYLVCLILVASVVLLMRQKSRFAPNVYDALLAFFLISIGTELSLTFYKTNGGWENVIGHLLKVTAFFFLYKAVVKTSLEEPYNRVREQAGLLEITVAERTSELQETNATLEEEIEERQAAQESLQEANAALLASVAARMKAEEAQKRHAEEVAATNRELQDFTNIVAHDFRSPMVNLKGFSKELDNSLQDLKQVICDDIGSVPAKANEILETEVPEALGFIQSSVDRLDRMVNALLQLARVGKRELIFQQVDCGELVNGVVRSFEHQIEKAGIEVAVGLMPVIESDPLALEQILGNLVDNAIKYLDSGRPGKSG